MLPGKRAITFLGVRRIRWWGPGVASVLVPVFCAVAAAAIAGNVVPAGGRIAGKGYGYWLARSWQRVFNSTSPVSPCQTLTANGRPVTFLTLTSLTPGTYAYRCDEPAGRPAYVDGLSNECSTFSGDHAGFGTTAADLRRCAKAGWIGAQETTTLNGRPVDMSTLVAGTRVYPVDAAQDNILGIPPGRGRSAAYGYGLGLTALTPGTTVIHSIFVAGTSSWDITWSVHAH